MSIAVSAGPLWTWRERIVVGLLIALFLLGAPGAGIETRDASHAPAWVAAAFTVAGIATLLALIASWKWPRAAALFGILGGSAVAVLSILDSAGIIQGPPPPAMVGVNAAIVAFGAALAWMCWRLLRRP